VGCFLLTRRRHECRRGTPGGVRYKKAGWQVDGRGMTKRVELVQGTLDMLILKAVSLGGLHGYGVLLRLQQLTGGQLQIQQGSLYPALYRLERQGLIASEWGESENKRKAKFYALTSAGRKKLKAEEESWNRFSAVVAGVLGAIPEES
jgi:PadR family transcriptional regulator PadR